MQIPLLDLAVQYESIRVDVTRAIEKVLHKTNFILGEELHEFEQAFARYCGAEQCVGVSSGTDALHLALRALGVGPGDEVITAANTFVATAFAIAQTGTAPVLVDVNWHDYNLDVDLLGAAITPRTKAIVPVHLFGQPADMGAIREIADKHGLKVVEDACQAHGALLGNHRVGTLSDAGCFSFYPGKNLGAYGDGGAVVTRDARLAERIQLLRHYGQPSKNKHTMLGHNARLDTLQAAVLRVKLAHLDEWNEKRRDAARLYRTLLRDCDVIVPGEKPGVRHVYHLFVIQHSRRDEALSRLAEEGICCGVHYPQPVHLAAPFLKARTVPEGAPVSTELSEKILSLPMFPELTAEQIHRVVAAIAALRDGSRLHPMRAPVPSVAG